jgi:TetR/AcrR family transcriptional repressor of nem operon
VCLLGNFGAEANSEVESIQQRVAEAFREERKKHRLLPGAAVKAGELPEKTKCDELAGFIHAAFEGAILVAKAERRSFPTESFKKILFSMLLAHKA